MMNLPRTPRVAFLLIVLGMVLFSAGCDDFESGGWGWKRATSTDDLMNFLNGTGAYSAPVTDFRLNAISGVGGVEFFVYYRRDGAAEAPATWGWKLATDVDDALAFLNGTEPYGAAVRDAQIGVVGGGSGPYFYIVYQSGLDDDVTGAWGWKRAPDASDVMRFLNGSDPYRQPVTTARIAEFSTGAHDEFFVFYQRSVRGTAVANWAWKRATDPDDAWQFVNGSGTYADPVRGYEVGAIQRGSYVDSHIFYNRGTVIWLQSPLSDERFVSGETASLLAVLTSDRPFDASELAWTSSLDGSLGTGPSIAVSALATGTHQVEVAGYGVSASTPVRVFSDLGTFYQGAPAAGEIARIRNDFTIDKVNGTGIDESWAPYEGSTFDQSSPDPTELAIIAKLDVLRHQRFAEPLPFTGGATIYEHLTNHVHTLHLYLECRLNSGGGGHIYLSRNMSVWDGRLGASPDNPDACKEPFANFQLIPYVAPLKLLVHEGRHSEPDDPGHSYCDGRPKDATLEGGSGYAQGALYDMWVYKYGLYDPPNIKNQAKSAAMSVLQGTFCSTPTHSNPLVQAVVNELLN